jgi:hypothetical protein
LAMRSRICSIDVFRRPMADIISYSNHIRQLMHGSPTARTEDFRQYGFIHMDMGHRGWTSHVHERSRALAATGAGSNCAEQDSGANIVEGEVGAIRLARISKIKK